VSFIIHIICYSYSFKIVILQHKIQHIFIRTSSDC